MEFTFHIIASNQGTTLPLIFIDFINSNFAYYSLICIKNYAFQASLHLKYKDKKSNQIKFYYLNNQINYLTL